MNIRNLPSFNFFSFANRMQLPALVVAIFLGIAIAPIIVAKPLIGMGLIAGLALYVAMTRWAEIPFLLLILSFAIPIQKTVGGIPINMADGVIVAWGLAWPFLMAGKNENTPSFQGFHIPKILWLLLPLTVAGMLSLVGAENPGTSFKQAIRLVEWFVVLPILLLSLRPSENFWRLTALAMLFVPSFFALDGVVEVLNHGNSISRMIGIPAPTPSALSDIRHTFDVSGRAGSTFGGAQGLAMYLTMMMSVILAIIFLPPHRLFRILALGAFLLCAAGMFFAKSRGGYIGCLVMLTITIFIMCPKPTFKTLLLGGASVVLAVMAFLLFSGWDGTISGLIPGRAESILDRLIIWQRALSIFSEHPINGVGLGGFHDAVYDHGGIRLNVPLGYESLHCHNTYLEILTGTGLLGFISYITFLVLTWRHLLRAWWNRTGALSDFFILGALGALAAYMMFGMVDMLLLQNMHILLVTLLSLGFLAADAGRKPSSNNEITALS